MKYRVVKDLESGDTYPSTTGFAMGIDLTAWGWLAKCVEWQDNDDAWVDNDDRERFIKYWTSELDNGNEQGLLCMIEDNWFVEFAKVE